MSDLTKGDGAIWLSYTELADQLGISIPSAKRRVQRSEWMRRKGNDGTTRILVPVSILPPDSSPGMSGGASADTSSHAKRIEALEAVAAEKERLIVILQADLERERAERRADAEQHKLSLAALGGTVDDLRDRLDRSEADRRKADERANTAMRSLEDFRAKPPRTWWDRLRGR